MALFESTLIILAAGVILLHLARRLKIPYPAMLALAGCGVAALPWTPVVAIEPHLALALFIAPAVVETAFDLPPRELLMNWLPLTSLAVLLVVATTAAVAWAGWALAGLPVAAAIVLGAIVSPPDAAAATAVLRQFRLPRRTMVVLQGESLLNDAVALLIFGAAVTAATTAGSDWTASIPTLLTAVPGGILLGIGMAALDLYAVRKVAGTLSSIVVQFTISFGTWVLADRLHLSSIAAVVSMAMVVAHYLPSRTSASDRVNANAVWASVVFVLNVLAFLLMGLQARAILGRLPEGTFWQSMLFGLQILGIVVAVRVVWVLTYGFILRRMRGFLKHRAPGIFVPSPKISFLVMWCGMRGLVTMATAIALPEGFPARDLIVLSAFFVVLGTLVLQGLTIRPLIGILKIPRDATGDADMSAARAAMLDAAIQSLADQQGQVADAVRGEYEAAKQQAISDGSRVTRTEHNALRTKALSAQRSVLHQWRRTNRVDDDVYHRLEQELDWAELHARPIEESQVVDA